MSAINEPFASVLSLTLPELYHKMADVRAETEWLHRYQVIKLAGGVSDAHRCAVLAQRRLGELSTEDPRKLRLETMLQKAIQQRHTQAVALLIGAQFFYCHGGDPKTFAEHIAPRLYQDPQEGQTSRLAIESQIHRLTTNLTTQLARGCIAEEGVPIPASILPFWFDMMIESDASKADWGRRFCDEIFYPPTL